jgi:nicotinamide-nucleotide amidase
MPATNLKQATLIKSASPIPNPNGTAPGWFTEKNKKIIVSLPGPPLELATMWNNTVKTKLKNLTPDIHIVTRNIKTHGISEGKLDELLTSLFNNENPYLGIYSKKDGIHLRIIAKSTKSDDTQAMVQSVENQILRLIGASVWGFDDDTPHQVAVHELQKRNLKLRIEESFTSGIISNNILSAKDSHKVFSGSNIIPRKECGGSNFKLTKNEILLKASHLDPDQNIQKLGTVTFTVRDVKQSTISRANYHDNSPRMKERAANYALISLISFIKAYY